MTAPSAEPPRAALGSRVLVMALAGIFLVGLVGFFVAVFSAADDPVASSPEPTAPAAATPRDQPSPVARRFTLALAVSEPTLAPPSGDPVATGDADAETSDGPNEVASPSATDTESSAGLLVESRSVPVVPVARFWSRQDSISRRELIEAIERGRTGSFERVVVGPGLRAALADSLGIEVHADVVEADRPRIERAVSRGALGLVLASEVSPRVRALGIGSAALFGNDRVKDVEDWPLVISAELPAEDAWEHDRTWVLVAGGDAFTDRGVYDSVVRKGRGVDYPFDGGTARVTGHGCCDPVFNDNVVPRYVLTGNKGAVRRLFRSAELAIANHEAPVTEAAAFHSSGTRFSGKPKLTRIFKRAGLDWVSLANNHIKDYGTDGIMDTRRILRRFGIGFGGAGKNLAQARKVSYLEVDDTTVAIIPCVGVARASWAGPRVSGGTPCLDRYLVPDIKRARKDADVVIVFPHWGVEYTRQPLPSMRKHAAKWVRAGADLILGGHSHVAGAIEDIDGSPVLYSLGNLIFDQHWSTNTMESILLEATFHRGQLMQLQLRPYIIHNQSQPNFLDPARGEGRRLLQSVRMASKGWLEW